MVKKNSINSQPAVWPGALHAIDDTVTIRRYAVVRNIRDDEIEGPKMKKDPER